MNGEQDKSAGTPPKEFRAALMRSKVAAKGFIGSEHWKAPDDWLSDTLTNAMAGAGTGKVNLLSLVPGRALFAELGKNLLSARSYLRGKEEMDALRSEWHARSDAVAQDWLKQRNNDPRGNDALMDLMHRSTLSGIDPSAPNTWVHASDKSARAEVSKHGDKAEAWAVEVMAQISAQAKSYATMAQMYDAMPEGFRPWKPQRSTTSSTARWKATTRWTSAELSGPSRG